MNKYAEEAKKAILQERGGHRRLRDAYEVYRQTGKREDLEAVGRRVSELELLEHATSEAIRKWEESK